MPAGQSTGPAPGTTPRAHGLGRDATNSRSMWLSLLLFLIPLMLSNTLQSIGGTVSSILLGHGLGEYALAAASAVFPVTFFLISFIIGLGSASSVLIGQAYGSGNTERMKATVGTSLTFAFILGLLTAVVGNLFARDLLELIGTPASIISYSIGYAHVLFTGLPFFFLYINYTTFLRGTGDAKTPFYFLLFSTILTVGLTPVFLFGWGGLPRLGVKGPALAMVVSSIITLIVTIAYLGWKRHPLALDRETIQKLRLDPQIVKLLIKIGLPTGIQMIFVSLSEVAVVTFVNRFGAYATAAYGAVIQVINYVQMPALSLGIAAGIFGAQLIGAGKQARLRLLVKSAVILNYVIGALLTGIVYLFSRTILSWFLTGPATLSVAEELLYITLWSFMIFGNMMILSGVMRSSGTVFWPTLIGIVTIWGVEVPVAYLLSHTIGLRGIWMAYPIAFAFGLAAQYTYYRLFWINRQHQRFFDGPEPIREESKLPDTT
ncbi:MATE family efflux transporter [Polycladomyces sp. WAk]|uniref:MATE family efflux transporter n=2 Tax=Polycladomyces zharkentensis TaxID=2807616 RepID=A0ABS2WKM6_9BACL|nr:MATE family efflux transporter [Polycladomyces sp. WAk]